MRRLILGFAILLMTIVAYGKGKSVPDYGSTIGIRLSAGAVIKQTELSIGHAFSPHWSVSGRASIALSHFFKGYDKEEKDHYGEFYELHGDEKNSFCGYAAAIYWPGHVYEGIYIRLGLCFIDMRVPDLGTAVGYCFNIWKGIYADVGYEAYLMSSYRNGMLSGNGINIGIHFKF